MNAQQLTYGSADRIEGRVGGGWGVLRRSAGLPPEVEQRLIEGVSVSMPSTVSAFPDSQELRNRPIRFRHRPDSLPGHSLVWHSVEAGRDHTQRPGNVFTHAARLAIGANARAIDWYASPSWLAPYGADEVQAAVPGEDVVPVKPGFAAVASWFHSGLTAHTSALPWLVDAIMAGLAENRAILLKVRSSADAAGWIGLVSWLFTDFIAARFSYSTCEDGTPADQLGTLGLDLLAVTNGDPKDSGRLRLLDTTWQVESAPDARSWQVSTGAVPRTPWSSMAMDLVWLDPTFAETVLELRDRLAPSVAHLAGGPFEGAQVALRLSMISVPGVVIAGREQALNKVLASLPPEAAEMDVVRALLRERRVGSEPTAVPDMQGHSPMSAHSDGHPVSWGPSFDAVPLGSQPPAAPEWSGEPATSHLPKATATPTVVHDTAPEIGTANPGSKPIGVTLGKPTAGSRVGAPARVMADYPFPTPMSAICAARVASLTGLDLGVALSGTRWLNGLSDRPEGERLALLHLVSQDRSTDLSGEEFDAAATALSRDDGFEAIAPALLLLGLRIETRDRLGLLTYATSRGWTRALAEFLERCAPEELHYLVLHFGALLAVVESDGRSNGWQETIGIWAAMPLPHSLWGMPIGSGRSVAQEVARLMA